jgi:glutaredoxin
MLDFLIYSLILITCVVIVYLISNSFTNFSEYKKIIQKPEDVEIKPLKTDKVVVLSREQCPYCTRIKEKLKDYTNYTIVSYNPDGSLAYDSNFSNMTLPERESITTTIDKFIKDSKQFGLFFPTVLYGSQTVIGHPSDDGINKIFKKLTL